MKPDAKALEAWGATVPDMQAIALEFMSRAHHFTCTILFDRHYHTRRFRTLAEARAYRPEIERLAGNDRKALVYCVTVDATTHFVSEDIPS